VTDYSNASRTRLFNVRTLGWDKELLHLLDIPAAMLPEAVPSGGVIGESDPAFFGAPIPIAGFAGDQQCALFGQTCFAEGDVKSTYGTGGFLLCNTGTTPIFNRNGLVTTIAWGAEGKVEYALEGSVFCAGSAVQWLRDEMRFVEDAAETEELAAKVADTNGCFLVPAFTGLGAPYWDPYARGVLVGLTRGVNRNHVVRATLESIAFQMEDVLAMMRTESGLNFPALRVDGGASRNDFLMQAQADISGVPVIRPQCVETTARGAAYLAGLATGFWAEKGELRRNNEVNRIFEPQIPDEEREEKKAQWHKAVERAFSWAKVD